MELRSDEVIQDLNPPLHVLPVCDQVEHTLDEDCCCGPRMDCVFRDDGSTGWICVHHALDGRP